MADDEPTPIMIDTPRGRGKTAVSDPEEGEEEVAALPETKDGLGKRPWSRRVLNWLRSAWSWRTNFQSVWDRDSTRLSISRSYVLDGLRAFAVLWVISFHVMTMIVADGLTPLISRLVTFWPAQIVFNGDMGVDVFFTLSGYLIGRILLKDLVRGHEHGLRGTIASILTFYLRRFVRIYPMLIAAIVITICSNQISLAVDDGKGFAVFPFASGVECTNFSEIWPMLLFVNNYFGSFYCMVQTWSVAVEVQMYILSPLIIWMAFSFKRNRPRRFGYAMLFLLSCANIGFNAIYLFYVQKGKLFFFIPHQTVDDRGMLPMGYVATWTRYSPYISGMTVAIWRWEKNFQMSSKGMRVYLYMTHTLVLLTIGTLLFLGVGTNWMIYNQSVRVSQVLVLVGRWAFGWCVAYVIWMCNNGRMRLVNAIMSLRCLYPLAVLSYGAYLLHLIFVTMLKGVDRFRAISPLQSVWVSWSVFSWDFEVCVILTFALAFVTYLLVEKPLMNLRPEVKFRKTYPCNP